MKTVRLGIHLYHVDADATQAAWEEGEAERQGAAARRQARHQARRCLAELHDRIVEAGLIGSPPGTLAVYGERGKKEHEFHLQGYAYVLTNGGPLIALQIITVLLVGCMLVDPEVNNTKELLVKLVGPSAPEAEPDDRPVRCCLPLPAHPARWFAYPRQPVGSAHTLHERASSPPPHCCCVLRRALIGVARAP